MLSRTSAVHFKLEAHCAALTGCQALSQSNLKSQIEFQIEIQCSKSMLLLVSLTNYIFNLISFANTLHLKQQSVL